MPLYLLNLVRTFYVPYIYLTFSLDEKSIDYLGYNKRYKEGG